MLELSFARAIGSILQLEPSILLASCNIGKLEPSILPATCSIRELEPSILHDFCIPANPRQRKVLQKLFFLGSTVIFLEGSEDVRHRGPYPAGPGETFT
jgi:hypothetical protein